MSDAGLFGGEESKCRDKAGELVDVTHVIADAVFADGKALLCLLSAVVTWPLWQWCLLGSNDCSNSTVQKRVRCPASSICRWTAFEPLFASVIVHAVRTAWMS